MSSSTSSTSPMGVAVAAGAIGAVVTIVLYWIHSAILFDGSFITDSGVWITIVVSAFLTGYIGVIAAQ